MNFLSAENISKTFSDKWLFKNINFGISQGEKIALVGQNGSGKTTLLNILAAATNPDEGTVSTRKGITIGYLSQQPLFDETMTVVDATFDGDNPMLTAIKNYEESLLSHDDKKLSDAIEQMEALKAWDYEVKIKQILGKLGIKESDLEKKISELSGGQRKRVALAKILIQDPDLIILDEPTNHLDLTMIEWLEHYLTTDNRTLLLVTHDRYFLDSVCNKIVSIEGGKITRYDGNYSYYLEKKAEKEAIEIAELSKNKNTYRRELEWIRKQPKARGTKAQYRVDAFEELKEKVTNKKETSTLELNVKMTRMGSKILEIENINKTFGQKEILKDFTYTFKKKDRIGIVGQNGVGKSTFLNLITGSVLPDNGKIEQGENTSYGYYTQSELTYEPGQRVIDVVKDIADVITLGTGDVITASQFLNLFQFPPQVQYTPVEKLSGGEKRRLQLLKVLIKNPNFLILDEPTNDLDIDTLNTLEEFLLNFQGCLLLVSHDRYFMDRLVENLFVFEGQGVVKNFNGNYTDYREWLTEFEQMQKAQKNQSENKPENKAENKSESKQISNEEVKDSPKIEQSQANVAKKKVSYKEQREYEDLEKEIDVLEEKKRLLVEKLSNGSSNHEEITAWAKEIEVLEKSIITKSDRWLELAEMM